MNQDRCKHRSRCDSGGGGWDVTSGQQGEGNGLTNQVIHGSGQDLLMYFLFFQARDDIIR